MSFQPSFETSFLIQSYTHIPDTLLVTNKEPHSPKIFYPRFFQLWPQFDHDKEFGIQLEYR